MKIINSFLNKKLVAFLLLVVILQLFVSSYNDLLDLEHPVDLHQLRRDDIFLYLSEFALLELADSEEAGIEYIL